MAETQAAHRQKIEAIAIKARSRDSLLGILSAASIALVTVVSGVYAVINGKVYSGTFLGSAGLAGVVGAFVYGTNQNRKERETKAKLL